MVHRPAGLFQSPPNRCRRGYLTAPGDLPNFEALREPGDGYLFVSMFGQTEMWGRYNMILDDNGEPIYYEQQEGNRSMYC